MSREKTLLSNTILYMAANFSSKIMSILLLPFYTHYFSASEYGYFDLINTTAMVLVPMIFLQINEGLYRFLLDSKCTKEVSSVITNTVVVTVRNTLLFCIAAIIFFQIRDIKHSLLILLLIVISALCWIWQQAARGLKNNGVFSMSGVVYTFVMLVSSIVLVVNLHMKVDGLLYSNILASAAMIFYIEWKLKILKMLDFKCKDRRIQRQLIRYSLPLLPNSINWWVMNFSSRYLINILIGPDANGLFAVASKFSSILMLINSIFYLAWQESAITEYSSKDKDAFYTKMFNVYMKVQLAAFLVLLPVTKWMMDIMVDRKFFGAWEYIPILYLGTVFSSFAMFYGTGYLSSMETKGALSTAVAGAGINIAGNLAFIPLFGLQAAAIANMLAFLIIWVIRVYQTKKYFKIRIESSSLIVLLSLSGLFTLIYFISSPAILIFELIAACAIFYCFNRQIIWGLINLAYTKLNLSMGLNRIAR